MIGRWRVWIWAVATIVLMALSAAGTWIYETEQQIQAGRFVPPSMLNNPQFARFVQVYDLIRGRTIWHSTPSGLLLGATKGMVSTLHDQFSTYLGSRSSASLNNMLNPTFTGIGVEIPLKKPLVIGHVFSGSPADQAGLKSGETIVSVNGRNVSAISPMNAVQLMRGPAGTSVSVTVLSHGHDKTYHITRRVIALPTVYSQMMPDHIAYMSIAEFGRNTGQEAVRQFHRMMAEGAKGILLDLRDNPGGEVSQALTVANLFVPKGPVVTLKYKKPLPSRTYDSKGPGTKLPVVVLVNGNTASAAEILSAAIQERQGGWLVGTRTYGKGIVQQVIPLSGNASLKLTVARYYTPNGQYIEHIGLRPNVTVEEPPGIIPSNNPAQDPQLQKAVTILLKRMGQPASHSAK